MRLQHMESERRRKRTHVVGIIMNVERLRHEMALRAWSASRLADRCGISRPSVTNALKGRPLKPATLRKIIRAIDSTDALRGADKLLSIRCGSISFHSLSTFHAVLKRGLLDPTSYNWQCVQHHS